MARVDSPWLGWNPVEIWVGCSLFNSERRRIDLGWRAGGIRNCSYAAEPGWIGVTAEDRTNGSQVLAIHEQRSGATRVLLREDSLLHHALNRSGSKVCYTQPSARTGTADLCLYQVADGRVRRLIEGVVAQGSTPAWFPDDVHITYHSAQGTVEVLDSARGTCEAATTEGEAPAISPDGTRIAFRRANKLFLWDLSGLPEPVGPPHRLTTPHLADGLSWAADGTHLSFGLTSGVVGKETTFYLLDIATRRAEKSSLKYLSGLVLAR